MKFVCDKCGKGHDVSGRVSLILCAGLILGFVLLGTIALIFESTKVITEPEPEPETIYIYGKKPIYNLTMQFTCEMVADYIWQAPYGENHNTKGLLQTYYWDTKTQWTIINDSSVFLQYDLQHTNSHVIAIENISQVEISCYRLSYFDHNNKYHYFYENFTAIYNEITRTYQNFSLVGPKRLTAAVIFSFQEELQILNPFSLTGYVYVDFTATDRKKVLVTRIDNTDFLDDRIITTFDSEGLGNYLIWENDIIIQNGTIVYGTNRVIHSYSNQTGLIRLNYLFYDQYISWWYNLTYSQ